MFCFITKLAIKKQGLVKKKKTKNFNNKFFGFLFILIVMSDITKEILLNNTTVCTLYLPKIKLGKEG